MLPEAKIIVGEAMEEIKKIPTGSVQCVITSPPYYGLRDYGTAQWEGGDSDCDHTTPRSRGEDIKPGDKQGTSEGSRPNLRWDCKCGAKRVDRQLGLEETPGLYIERLVKIGRELKRVLRDDGIFWLNLGDSYYNYRPGKGSALTKQTVASNGQDLPQVCPRRGMKLDGFKEKDRMMIPARVAIGLCEDGWYLRDEIIWSKPNPMPSSATDRTTCAHEFIYMLTKRKDYYYNQDAIKEPYTAPMNRWGGQKLVAKGQSTWDEETGQQTYRDRDMRPDPNGRIRRSVWEVATSPYADAHFATYPPDLIQPCILAGSRPGDTILDCFAGSGTTGMSALELGRNAILIELNPKYLPLMQSRCDTTPGFELI